MGYPYNYQQRCEVQRKRKQSQPECLTFSKKDADTFMKAVEITSQKTLISNNSISRKDDWTIEILDTRASFLISIGMNYAWLTKKDKE